MSLATYKAPYTLRQILNVDPSISATPEPKAESLAYEVSADQAALNAQARQREENIAIKELALANQEYKAENRLNLMQGELDLAKKQAPESLAFATAGAAFKNLGAYMQAKKTEDILTKMATHSAKMEETSATIMKNLGIQKAEKTGQITTEQEANAPSPLRRWGH